MSAWIFAAGLTVFGWAALSHALPRHHQEAFGRVPNPARLWLHRMAGWLALICSFAVCVAALGLEFGPVMWTVLLCLGAVVWVLCRNADPRRARWLGWSAPLPGLVMLATGIFAP